MSVEISHEESVSRLRRITLIYLLQTARSARYDNDLTITRVNPSSLFKTTVPTSFWAAGIRVAPCLLHRFLNYRVILQLLSGWRTRLIGFLRPATRNGVASDQSHRCTCR